MPLDGAFRREDDAPLPGPLSVRTSPSHVDSGELEQRFPAHRLIVEPLLRVAVDAVVHRVPRSPFMPLPPGARRGTVLALDLRVRSVAGFESFWNASGWDRGCVSIRVPEDGVHWATLFSWTEYTGVFASRYQLAKSTPRSAIKYGDERGRSGFAVVAFPSSIASAEIWADPARCDELHSLAQTCCRRFVRWAQNGTYPREIIVDREPYASRD